MTSEEERRPHLEKKYKFSCQCSPCTHHWQTYQHLPKSFNDLRPDQLRINPQDMQGIQAKMKTIMQLGAKINQVSHTVISYKKLY